MEANDDVPNELGSVRMTLRLPRDLHERLQAAAANKPGSSLNSEIIAILNAGLLDDDDPDALVRHIRQTSLKLSAAVRYLRSSEKMAVRDATKYRDYLDKAWRKLLTEGRDPSEFFEVTRSPVEPPTEATPPKSDP